MPCIIQSIPGVIWYIILEYIGFNMLDTKKCVIADIHNNACENNRDCDEIWCSNHCKIVINMFDKNNACTVMNKMLGGVKIEQLSYNILKKKQKRKRIFLTRNRFRHAYSVYIEGLSVFLLNGIYKPLDYSFINKHNMLTNTVVYIKSFGNNYEIGMHLYLWKHSILKKWFITTKYLLKNDVDYRILENTSYAWCESDANHPDEIKNTSIFKLNINTLYEPDATTFNPEYTFKEKIINTFYIRKINN